MTDDTRTGETAVAGRDGPPDDLTEGLTVGRVAAHAGISVKTLHHWDAIGLVRPSGRTWAGYRVYSAEDIARIQRTLVYRELGFPLAEIGRILDAPDTGARGQLRRQRRLLLARIERLEGMVGAVDRMMAASAPGMRLTPQQQIDIFGSGWQPSWVTEAEERWGDSPQWAQYAERAAGMSPARWAEVAATTETLNADLVRALRAGVVPGSAEAEALAARHRELMSTYFDCTPAMQVCMGRMFVEDPGFAANYEALAPGLAVWLREVFFASARAQGVDPETARWG
ncbi:MerR family transcriptional regulator [Streptomyces sp. NPDC000594]|uniref:MerR family transcriptional regulator n=1 Tax=Streptomyces sp. NPDC000594 TaxID=3154261 RepID=UPI00332BC6DA